jgi:hypothetical protein
VGGIRAGGDAQFANLESFGERDFPHQFTKFGGGPLALTQHDLAEECGRDALAVE